MSDELDGDLPGDEASAHPSDAEVWRSCKSAPRQEIAELRAAIDRFTATPATPPHPSELCGDLQALRQCIDLLELEFARKAAEFAATDAYDRFGSLSPEDWIRHAWHLSGAAASSAVRVGDHMNALPESTAAVRDARRLRTPEPHRHRCRCRAGTGREQAVRRAAAPGAGAGAQRQSLPSRLRARASCGGRCRVPVRAPDIRGVELV